MMEIGREDLIREQTLSNKKRTAAKTAKAKVVKKAAATGKSKTTRKTAKSSSVKTVRTIRKI